MLDLTTRILLEKYQPDSPLLEAKVEKSLTVVMNSALYPESEIMKACCDFNAACPELMSHSYTLPVAMYGIPAGSWILRTTRSRYTGDKE
ncbi:hypothetical protein D9M71_815120 [compost metagenome]